MLRYITNYWNGRYSIAMTVAAGIVFPLCLLLAIQTFWLDEQIAQGNLGAGITSLSMLCIYAVLFTWQVMGINRSIASHGLPGSLVATLVVNALMLAVIVYALVRLTDLITSHGNFANPHSAADGALTQFDNSLNLHPHKDHANWLVVSGTIGIAATRQLRSYLESHSTPDTIVLDSDGGNIFEARGIGKLIADNRLSTHVETVCYSACTIAFVQGKSRSASTTAEFGFHSYRIEAKYPKAVIANVSSQQEKDQQIFQRNGVSADFIAKIYQSSANQLWKPDQALLKSAGFLNHNSTDLP